MGIITPTSILNRDYLKSGFYCGLFQDLGSIPGCRLPPHFHTCGEQEKSSFSSCLKGGCPALEDSWTVPSRSCLVSYLAFTGRSSLTSQNIKKLLHTRAIPSCFGTHKRRSIEATGINLAVHSFKLVQERGLAKVLCERGRQAALSSLFSSAQGMVFHCFPWFAD